MIEFDVESRGLQWYWPDQSMFLAQFKGKDDPHDGPHTPVLLPHPAKGPAIQEWLDAHDNFRAWNTKFDMHMAKAAGYELPPQERWYDGMIEARIIDERRSGALEARAALLFGDEIREPGKALKAWLEGEGRRRRKASKDDGTEFVSPNYSHVPWDIMEPYAAQDVELPRKIGAIYGPQIEQNEEYRSLYEMERVVLGALFDAEERGIHVDRDALARLEASLLPQLDAQEGLCRRIAGFKNFNPRSPKQIGEALDRLGADTRFMTRNAKTKQLVTDNENLEACDHPLAEAILRYRGIHKLWAMIRRMLHGKPGDPKFPAPYLTSEDLLHPSFNQVGARTGRMSCSNPNFQQIHRDDLRLRYAIQARPGKKLVCVDLDSIEIILLAAFAGEGPIRESILRGEDPHIQTAKRVGLTGRKRSTGAIESPRDQGKRMNYLTVYGGGVRAIRKWFGIPQAEARSIIARYRQEFPEVVSLQNRIEFALEDRGYIKSPWGRRFRVERSAEREAYKFVNYLIQGTAADLFKASVARLHQEGVPITALVHDEVIAEVDASDADEAGVAMVAALTEHPRITETVPVTAEAKIVDRWSQAKDPEYIPDYLED